MTTSPKSESAAKKDVTKLQRAIVDGLEDVKAVDIQVFNTEALSPLFERVIVATGNSNRQTKALASSVRDAVKEAGFHKPRTEGEDNGEWIIVDCGQAVAHIMQPAIRQYYRLEEIWGETPVRLKLGAVKPRKITASEDASAEGKKKPAAKKAPARKTAATAKPAAKSAAKPAAKPAAKSAAKPAAKPAAKSAAKPTAARKPVAAKKSAASTSAAGKPAARKPAAKAAPIQIVKVNKPSANKKASPKAAAAPKKAPARKAPARKA